MQITVVSDYLVQEHKLSICACVCVCIHAIHSLHSIPLRSVELHCITLHFIMLYYVTYMHTHTYIHVYVCI